MLRMRYVIVIPCLFPATYCRTRTIHQVKLVAPPKNADKLQGDELQKMLDLRLEAMLTICDLLEDGEDESKKIIPEYAKEVAKAGLKTEIAKFDKFKDQELIDIGQDILASLKKVGA